MIRMFQEEGIASAKTLGWEGDSLHEDLKEGLSTDSSEDRGPDETGERD